MLKTLRRQKQYSLAMLTRLSGVSKSQIALLERTDAAGQPLDMRLSTLGALAAAYGLPRHELLRRLDAAH